MPTPRPRRRPRGARRARGDAAPPSAAQSWDHVADWYDRLVGDEGSDYHQHVILPVALRLLHPQPGQRILDLCCGQGVLCRRLLEHEVGFVLGVDASPQLIAAARSRSKPSPRLHYVVRDATNLQDLADGSFDAAACVMALQDLEDLDGALREIARALRTGGRAVLVMMHPCFRIPRQSEWGWDDAKKTRYRRLDRYANPMQVPIATHPGRDPRQQTFFFHRPLAAYLNALARAGLALSACEEPLSHRESTTGGRGRGENRAAREFPVFLALAARKVDASLAPPAGPPDESRGEHT